MGELILYHFKVVYTLNNKTVVACVDKTDIVLSSGLPPCGYRSKD